MLFQFADCFWKQLVFKKTVLWTDNMVPSLLFIWGSFDPERLSVLGSHKGGTSNFIYCFFFFLTWHEVPWIRQFPRPFPALKSLRISAIQDSGNFYWNLSEKSKRNWNEEPSVLGACMKKSKNTCKSSAYKVQITLIHILLSHSTVLCTWPPRGWGILVPRK